ncbi:hypothetical protein CspeluHIS016_0703220 [Cutaneotrichosporon spelunceum]|uniref:Uncharacterized protein n=1 Tax=Cutaneotrichosporon spelunceum TaxID=1672016 RepID=A0AAD3TZL8_9TREE|nr:hypothetical protein CspeluHIS016_0703220 [Cutaneotrichosporon spelunceum]
MPHPQPQQAPPPHMRPHPPPPVLRPSRNIPSLPQVAQNSDRKDVGKPRSRRRGRRAGIGNKARRTLGTGDSVPSPDTARHEDGPLCYKTLDNSPPPSPTFAGTSALSTPPPSRDRPSDSHKVIFAHLDLLDRLERLERLKLSDSATLPPEIPLITPPQTAATCNDRWPSQSRTHEWPPTPSFSSTLGRASRRPAYIGSHLPIPTINLPETKPFLLGTPDFGEIERSLPEAYNADYPHPLTVYASPGVNAATVVVSGYGPLLRELQETNPRAAMGGILADCGNDHMTAPALLLTHGSKDGCGIPEKLWLQLSSCAGVKVPIGAVLPAAMAARGCSPRFLQASNLESPLYSLQNSPPSPPSGGIDKTDGPESPLFSIFAKAQRLALSGTQPDIMNTLDDRETTLAPQALYKRRGSLPDLCLGAKRKADLLSGDDDEWLQLYSLVSPRRIESRATDENLICQLLSARRGTQDLLGEIPTKAGHLPSLQPRYLSPCFDALSTVEEADDDHTVTPSRPIEPIGAERHTRGKLPRLPLYLHRDSRTSEDNYSPRTPSQPTSGRPSTAGSAGTRSSLVSPAGSFYQPITPTTGATDVFGHVLYTSRSSSSEDEFTLGTNPTRSAFFSHSSQSVIHQSLPTSGSSTPREGGKVGLFPCEAWHDPPVSTTTLDFSTGKSIWV